ncbi:MAG TPA: polysaccharide pyruvyl transferase CsaB [Thermosynechococcus sp. M3746_W2019_013]|uniref:polysaccharide pyruvyl transferase CsaB n=1 Tax=Thermosynechococcus sp. M3746_W2019_013 TaxID=2747806 RepID=UPI0019E134BA|nr:polysaccharide pyruvyl transferase CsaB [Thermosynechococcus sp. M3746_W2019_013]HIK23931.1 polysaccharide pyruvyl transferase CsaB [Thermosynechococcus sp. M3746_W2019_013]
MSQVFLCGYYGYGNTGDEALLATLLEQLPRHVSPVVLSGNPRATADRYGVGTCDRRQWQTVLRTLQQSHAFIWGGGSLIQDVTSWRSPLYYLGLMTLAQRFGCRTIAWAQGIGPLRSPLYRWWTRKLLRRCVAVTVRDSGSAALLRQWGIPHQQGADPVWLMSARPGLPPQDRAPIAVCLRPHRHLTSDRWQLLKMALRRWQEETGVLLLLLPFQRQQDLPLAEDLYGALLPDQTQLISCEDPREMKGILAATAGAIAMRLHALIMAASVGCRCFALSYDPKVRYLMADTGMAGVELAALPPDPTALIHQWQHTFSAPVPSYQAYLQSAAVHKAVLNLL